MAESSSGAPPPDGRGSRRRPPPFALLGGAALLAGALFAVGFLGARALAGDSGEPRSAPATMSSLPSAAPSTIATTVTVEALAAAPRLPTGLASTGLELVEVPLVVGLAEHEARSVLEDGGFRVEVRRERASVPAGEVVGQSPPAGTQAPTGSAVTIIVSTSETEGVTVPPVVGMTRADAEAVLRDNGLVPNAVDEATSDPGSDGRVLSQDPVSGTAVPAGTSVTITIGVLA